MEIKQLTKKCTCCGVEKTLSEFHKNKRYKLGVRSKCKICRAEENKQYRENNREKILEHGRQWYKNNREKSRDLNKKYRENNREKILEYQKQYRKNNRGKIRELNKQYRENNREYHKQYYENNKESLTEYKKQWYKNNKQNHSKKAKQYYKDNKEKIIENVKQWVKNNKETVSEYRRQYSKDRYQSDYLFKFRRGLSTRTYNAFKRKSWKKNGGTEKLLGCDWETAFNHIESQFDPWMNWDNHGEWHIDHIIPLASATTDEEMKKLCHYTNLQPLLAEENLSKGDKIRYEDDYNR